MRKIEGDITYKGVRAWYIEIYIDAVVYIDTLLLGPHCEEELGHTTVKLEGEVKAPYILGGNLGPFGIDTVELETVFQTEDP